MVGKVSFVAVVSLIIFSFAQGLNSSHLPQSHVHRTAPSTDSGPGISLPIPTGTPTFSDNFRGGKLDTTKWGVATWKAADTRVGSNVGSYVPEMISFSDNTLRIGVTQRKGPNGVISKGGAIRSKEVFGFGTYQIVMRQTSTSITSLGRGSKRSGGISSCFLYLPNSESEIDIEFRGDTDTVWATNWHNTEPENAPTSVVKHSEQILRNGLTQGFHTYTLVWLPTSVTWYIDGKQYVQHTDHVPQLPAHIIIQHRGTNSTLWGGNASVGEIRYAYFKSVSFIPLGAK